MLVPLPAFILDLLLATSFAASVLVLLSALQILRPAQFSVFPSLLLLLTLFRLSLNLASSRRILLHGNEGAGAAGHVIEAFGQFVVGGNYIVGFVLFIALIAIQYIVVSHGAVRTAEVTARFTLDALPGKQMAIDADLNAGLIDEHQARARREQTAREAEFYGAMDGAARFNQRDSIATILITGINILAGFLIGVFQLDIPFREALKTYTVLTVGDGLVTMIPSLLVSMAGGMVVTRASSNATLSADLGTQLLSRRRSLQIAAGVMVALAAFPGCRNFRFSPSPASSRCSPRACPSRVKDKDGKVIEPPLTRRAAAAGEKDKKAAQVRLHRRPAQARRTLARSRLCAGHPGRRAARRTTARPRQVAAQQPGRATRLHRSAHSHHRQRPPQAARIRDLAARRRNRALGNARGSGPRHQLRTHAARRWPELPPASPLSASPRSGLRARSSRRR